MPISLGIYIRKIDCKNKPKQALPPAVSPAVSTPVSPAVSTPILFGKRRRKRS